MLIEEEIWRDVDGYEGRYQVSNMGRVRSLDMELTHRNGKKYIRPGKILSQSDDKDGYKKVTLTMGGRERTVRVHILVAKAFIPNPNNYPVINHKNAIKHDNRASNLEWCTVSHNTRHGYIYGNAKSGAEAYQAVKVEVYRDGNLIAWYGTQADAAKGLGVNKVTIYNYIDSGKFLYDELLMVSLKEEKDRELLNKVIVPDGRMYNPKYLSPIAVYRHGSMIGAYKNAKRCAEILNIRVNRVRYWTNKGEPYKDLWFTRISAFDFLFLDKGLIDNKISLVGTLNDYPVAGSTLQAIGSGNGEAVTDCLI